MLESVPHESVPRQGPSLRGKRNAGENCPTVDLSSEREAGPERVMHVGVSIPGPHIRARLGESTALRGLKSWAAPVQRWTRGSLAAPTVHSLHTTFTLRCGDRRSLPRSEGWQPSLGRRGKGNALRLGPGRALRNVETALSGGSLGSCVDEERSQLRYLM